MQQTRRFGTRALQWMHHEKQRVRCAILFLILPAMMVHSDSWPLPRRARPAGDFDASAVPRIPRAAAPTQLPTYTTLPLIFEANQGQTDSQVKFLARGSGYTLFLTAT